MAALQLVRDAAEQCDSGMALALHEAVMPRLAALLSHPEPVLLGGALRAAASLLGAALEAAPAPLLADGLAADGNGSPAGGGPPARQLLGALKGVLDVTAAEEVSAEVQDAALDAGQCLPEANRICLPAPLQAALPAWRPAYWRALRPLPPAIPTKPCAGASPCRSRHPGPAARGRRGAAGQPHRRGR